MQKNTLSLGILLFIVFLSFSSSLNNKFVYWDDTVLIGENRDIHALSFYNLKALFTNTYVGTYIPLSLLSFALEYQITGPRPFLYHLDNLLIHLAVICLIFVFARRMDLSFKAAWLAAFIFGLHPMNVESVAWVSERKDVLFTFFYLLSLLSYERYLTGGSKKSYGLSLLFCLLSILSKPMAYSLPFGLWLMDYLKGRGMTKEILLDKVPFFVVIIGISFLTFSGIPISIVRPLDQCLLIWIYAFCFYLYKFIFPLHLIPIYEIPSPTALTNFIYLFSLIAFMCYLWLMVKFRKSRLVLFANLFYVVTIGIIVIRTVWDFGNNTLIAERFMYLPKMGYCLLAGFLLGDYFDKSKASKKLFYRSVVLFVLLGAVLGLKTFQQCPVWKDNETLWKYVIEKDEGSKIAYINRGTTYLNQQKYDWAQRDYHKALSIDPDDPKIYFLLGNLFTQINVYDDALKNYQEALKRKHDYDEVYFRMGNLHYKNGQLAQAIENYEKTLHLAPDNDKAYYNLGIIYDDLNEKERAVEYYTKAITAEPRNSMAYNNRGFIYLENKQYEKALNDFNRAVSSDHSNAEAFNSRGTAYFYLGKLPLAADDFTQALKLDPRHTLAQQNLVAVKQALSHK